MAAECPYVSSMVWCGRPWDGCCLHTASRHCIWRHLYQPNECSHHLPVKAASSLTNTAIPLLLQFFVVGHDCGHRSFSKNKLLEDIVGTLAFAPLIYPFEPWRIKHNHHHAHTNKCVGLLHRAA